MKIPHSMSNDAILDVLNHSYDLMANQLTFIPIGDKSYGYKVDCANGAEYFLKLLDKQNQKDAVQSSGYYLPLLHSLQVENLFPAAVHPILNKKVKITTETNIAVFIVFPWIAGPTLADAYPFSEPIVREIAKQVAKLHLSTPHISDKIQLPIETYDLSFGPHLRSYLQLLEAKEFSHEQSEFALAQLVLPRKEEIIQLMNDLERLKPSLSTNEAEFVLCHGDLWGGNFIQSQQGIRIIDWESVSLAPLEYDFVKYIAQSPIDFIDAYSDETGKQVILNFDLLKFYSFKAHILNLTNWIENILFRHFDDVQKKNDLNMIEFHCLDRFDSTRKELNELEIQLS